MIYVACMYFKLKPPKHQIGTPTSYHNLAIMIQCGMRVYYLKLYVVCMYISKIFRD